LVNASGPTVNLLRGSIDILDKTFNHLNTLPLQ
jgi:hypothetical protein